VVKRPLEDGEARIELAAHEEHFAGLVGVEGQADPHLGQPIEKMPPTPVSGAKVRLAKRLGTDSRYLRMS
jgi:hypothetical protein